MSPVNGSACPTWTCGSINSGLGRILDVDDLTRDLHGQSRTNTTDDNTIVDALTNSSASVEKITRSPTSPADPVGGNSDETFRGRQR